MKPDKATISWFNVSEVVKLPHLARGARALFPISVELSNPSEAAAAAGRLVSNKKDDLSFFRVAFLPSSS